MRGAGDRQRTERRKKTRKESETNVRIERELEGGERAREEIGRNRQTGRQGQTGRQADRQA